MLQERFKQVKERFIKPQAIDIAERLLNERFQKLNLNTQEIEVFGVEFLGQLMDKSSLKNLKIAKIDAKNEAKEFNISVIESMGDSDHSKLVKERLEGVLAYGALQITKETLKDEKLSYRKKKRKLVFLETFLNENGIVSEHSKFLVKEAKKEAKKQETVKNLVTSVKFVFGAAIGFLGSEYAEKYVSFLPAAQEALGLAIIIGTSTSRAVTRLASKKSSKWEALDRALAKVQPVLMGVGFGMAGHGLFDQLETSGEILGKGLEGITSHNSIDTHQLQLDQNIQPVEPQIPEIQSPTQVYETINYTTSGSEYGGITDVIAHFHQDPYGDEMTRFILENKDALIDPTRTGHESADKLIRFLQSNESYTWRDAMNESAREGHATEVSKLFTDALRFIKPGTTFVVPVQ